MKLRSLTFSVTVFSLVMPSFGQSIDDDWARVNSCLKLAVTLEGAAVRTIEGMAAADGTLHPLQEAFIRHDGFQCGYCTPGQICSAQGLIDEGRARSRDEIRELMSGNLCRCGAYPNIVAAIQQAMERA